MNKNQKAILALALMAAMVIGAFAVVGDSADVVAETTKDVDKATISSAATEFGDTYYNKGITEIQGLQGYILIGTVSSEVTGDSMHVSVGNYKFIDFPVFKTVSKAETIELYAFFAYLMFESENGLITIEGIDVSVPTTPEVSPVSAVSHVTSRGDAWVDGKTVSYINYGSGSSDYVVISLDKVQSETFFTKKVYEDGSVGYGFTSDDGVGNIGFYPCGWINALGSTVSQVIEYSAISLDGYYSNFTVYASASLEKMDAVNGYNDLIGDSASASLNIDRAAYSYEFLTLEGAWNYAAKQTGVSYITLLKDSQGPGLFLDDDVVHNIDLFLAGHTYTCVGPAVGSTGYESQALHLEKGNNVTISVGTIDTIAGKGVKMLVQNYSNLILKDVVLDGRQIDDEPGWPYMYVMSNNNGTVEIGGSTIIAAAGDVAFDVCGFQKYDGPKVNVFGSKIIGNIEISSNANAHEMALTIDNSTVITGYLNIADNNAYGKFSAVQGQTDLPIVTANGVTGNYFWSETGKLLKGVASVVIGTGESAVETAYDTLAEAWYAAVEQSTPAKVYLQTDSSGNGLAVADGNKNNVNVVLDLKGHTYTFSGGAVGSIGYESQGFHLNGTNRATNSVTIQNGTITSTSDSKVWMLIQNYLNLTLNNLVVDATNYKWYAMSNNNGNVVINDSTITASPGYVAFDVCGYHSYESVTVTVNGNSVINGIVEISNNDKDRTHDVNLIINGGTFNGSLSILPENDVMSVSDIKKASGVDLAAPTGYFWNNAGEMDVLVDGKVMMGTVAYGSINDAIAAIPENGSGSIKLIGDVKEDVVIPSNKDVTIDLNGYKITNVDVDTIYVKNGANLTLIGEGTVDNVRNGYACLFNNGYVEIDGPTFTRSAEGVGNSYYNILNHGEMEFKDGTVINTGGSSSLFANGYYGYYDANERIGYVSGVGLDKPTLSIIDGVFDGGMNTIKNDDGAILTIEGGSFSNTTQHSILNHNVATINGGEFTVTSVDYVIYNCGCDSSIDMGALTITGGIFNGGLVVHNMYTSEEVAEVSISGGTFDGKLAVGTFKSIKVTGGTFVGMDVLNYITGGTVVVENIADLSTLTVKDGVDLIIKGTYNLDNITLGANSKLKVDGILNIPMTLSNITFGTGSELIILEGSELNDFEVVSGTIACVSKTIADVSFIWFQVDGQIRYTGTALDLLDNIIGLSDGSKFSLPKNTTLSGTVRGPDYKVGDDTKENKVVLKNIKFTKDVDFIGGSITITGGIYTEDPLNGTITVSGPEVKISGTLDAGTTLMVEKDTNVTFSNFTQDDGATIKFQKADDSYSTDIPMNQVSVGADTSLKELPYTIGKGSVDLVYNGQEQAFPGVQVTFKEVDGVVPSFQSMKVSGEKTGINVAAYSVTLEYYKNADLTGLIASIPFVWNITPLDITGATVTITQKDAESSDLVYNGTEQIGTVTSVVIGGVTVPLADCAFTGKAAGAGSHTLTVGPSATGNITGTATGEFYIKKATATVTVNSIGPITYGDAIPTPGATVTGTYGDVLDYTLEYRQGGIAVTPENAGTYDIVVVPGENANYNISPVNKILTINKASISPAVTIAGWTYGDSAKSPLVTGNLGGGAVIYNYYDGTTPLPGVPSNAGTMYYVEAVIGETTNYLGKTVKSEAPFIIAPKTVAVTGLSVKDKVYDGNAIAEIDYSAVIFNGMLVGDELGVIANGEFAETKAGTWSVTITLENLAGASAGNYELSSTSYATLNATIVKAAPTVTEPTAKTLTYTGSAQDLLNAGTSSDGTFEYSADGSSWSATIPQGTAAGPYTVYWRFVGDENHFDVASTQIDVTITKRSITTGYGFEYNLYKDEYGDVKANITVKATEGYPDIASGNAVYKVTGIGDVIWDGSFTVGNNSVKAIVNDDTQNFTGILSGTVNITLTYTVKLCTQKETGGAWIEEFVKVYDTADYLRMPTANNVPEGMSFAGWSLNQTVDEGKNYAGSLAQRENSMFDVTSGNDLTTVFYAIYKDGTSATETWTVEVTTPSNGTVSTVSSVPAGQPVIVFAQANSGYYAEKMAVGGVDYKPISEGVFMFYPASNVTITVTFTQKAQSSQMDVYLTQIPEYPGVNVLLNSRDGNLVADGEVKVSFIYGYEETIVWGGEEYKTYTTAKVVVDPKTVSSSEILSDTAKIPVDFRTSTTGGAAISADEYNNIETVWASYTYGGQIVTTNKMVWA